MGGIFDGEALTVAPTSARLVHLQQALRCILRRPRLSGQELEHSVGHLLTILLFYRLHLSVLGNVYDFIRDSYICRQTLWPSVLCELRLALWIVPLCRANLAIARTEHVYMTGACPLGFAIARSPRDF